MFNFSITIGDAAWLTISGILFAITLWAYDNPMKDFGKKILFPIWVLTLLINTISVLCFILNLSILGKHIVTIELLLIGVIAFFALFCTPLFHYFDVTPSSKFHDGIGPGNYFK